MILRQLSRFGVALAVLGVATVPSFGQNDKNDKNKSADQFQKFFEKMDRSGDGKLDFKEVRAAGQFEKDTFDKYDGDKDGFLTPAEMKAGLKAHPDKTPAQWKELMGEKHEAAGELTESELKAVYAKIDLNHDGKVDWKEAESAATQRETFDRYDLNSDGSVLYEEFEGQYAVDQAKRGRLVAKAIAEKVKAAREADVSFAMGDRAMKSLDGDGDGAISIAEITAKIPEKRKNAAAAFKPLFTTADVNDDKKLDAAEWTTFQKSVRAWTEAAHGPVSDKMKEHAEKAKKNPGDKP